MLRIFGDEIPLRARVEVLNGYSAHADRRELKSWLDAVSGEAGAHGSRKPPVWLVHGEPDAQEALAGELGTAGYRVTMPARGDRAPL